jgi:hypothetical protein
VVEVEVEVENIWAVALDRMGPRAFMTDFSDVMAS